METNKTNIFLSNKQQKQALSAKKRPKENIRNILANPYSRYWPIIKESDHSELKDALYEHMSFTQKLKPKNIAVPISVIQHVPKEKRKAARSEFRKDSNVTVDSETQKSLVLGVNAVTKHLEARNISAVLIHAEVSPQFMVQHVIDLAAINNIPVLIVPKLKEILMELLGIKALAFGFKSNLQCGTPLWIIYESIKNIATNYPIPNNNPNNLQLDLRTDTVDDTEVDDSMHNIPPSANTFSYLRRACNTERVFVPPNNNVPKIMNEVSDNFIPLCKEVKKVKLESLTVKRVRSNKFRPNKKLKQLL